MTIEYFSSYLIQFPDDSFLRRQSMGVAELETMDFPTILRLQTEKEILKELVNINWYATSAIAFR